MSSIKLKSLLEVVAVEPGFKMYMPPYNTMGQSSFEVKMRIRIPNDSKISDKEIVKLLSTGNATISKGMNVINIIRTSDNTVIAQIESINEA